MARETLDQLLRRARVRPVDDAELSQMAADVRRQLGAQPSTVVRVRPAMPFGARWLIPVTVALLAVTVLARATTRLAPIRLAQHETSSLEEDVAILHAVGANDVLDDEEGLLDELEWLELEQLSQQG